MKNIILLLSVLFSTIIFSQNRQNYNFGRVTADELKLKKYSLDTTANAVVLYESGNTIFLVKEPNIIVRTKHYRKIKLFNKDGYKHASFSISLYNNSRKFEKVTGIKAITHNNSNKTFLSKEQIFKNKVNENWTEVKFTMPNLKEGCVIEVEYTIETPFKFNLTGWNFQSDIPKKFSQFKAAVPGNYIYNRKLTGYLKLKTNSSTIKKRCFSVPGYSGEADCEQMVYEMENIPAFEDEDYITSKDNFISTIKFELSETKWFDGSTNKYTTTWKAVDKEFKTDKNIGGQIRKVKFFKENLPIEINVLDSDLKKAKAVYYFIQNHFTWNKKNSIFKNVKVKNAFKNKIGNVGEINISLINSLKAVGLNTEMLLISTRNNGTPTKIHPVISDFNYLLAKVNINNKIYLLDATNKLTPFGLLPLKCLNGYGRVMDFKNESYWYDIIPEKKSQTKLSASLLLNEDGSIKGKIRKSSFGHFALSKREKYLNKNEDDIISKFEDSFNNLEVTSYSILNKNELEKPIIETFEFIIENNENSTNHFLNPFFNEKFSVNPFKQENRLHPVNFGYPRQHSVNFTLELPDNFKIKSIPESKSFALPENGGNFTFLMRKNNDYKITINSNIKINKPIYYNFEYQSLKNLFKEIINSQKESIVLEKIKT